MTLINRFLSGSVCLLSLATAAGCGGGSGSGHDGGADTGAACAATGSGTGTLTVHVAGLPASASAAITVNNSAGTVVGTVTVDQTLTLPVGPYAVTADRVAAADPIARAAYEPSISGATPCVNATGAASVTVTYNKIASSNKLWVGNASDVSALMLGFAPAAVAASGSPPATVGAKTVGAGGFTFDVAGNLWVIGGTVADPPLARYSAATLGTTGAKVADVTIAGDVLAGGSPGPVALAFDATGGLWVSVGFTRQVVRYTPAQVAAGGAPTPAIVLTEIDGPAGLAFDSAKNLWVASAAGVIRFNAARLAASTTGPDLTITANTPLPVVGALSAPTGLAFDGTGNLWVNYEGVVARIEPADLQATTATAVITPAVQVSLDVESLPLGLAFDEGGGLWLGYTMGKVARLAPTQLTSSGAKAPATVIASPDIGYTGWVGLYPAPAASPLYHRLP